MTWAVGDTGTTRGGMRYRILATDLVGNRGPIAAALRIADEELLHRYPASGVHPGPHRAYDLQPAKVRA